MFGTIPESKFGYTVRFTQKERISDIRVLATGPTHALRTALRRLCGFRTFYSFPKRRIYRTGRHGRFRKVLIEDVGVVVTDDEGLTWTFSAG